MNMKWGKKRAHNINKLFLFLHTCLSNLFIYDLPSLHKFKRKNETKQQQQQKREINLIKTKYLSYLYINKYINEKKEKKNASRNKIEKKAPLKIKMRMIKKYITNTRFILSLF